MALDAIWLTLSELKSIALETQRSLGRVEGTQESHGERLDRIEERQRPRLKVQDFTPLLPGLIVLGLAILGKMTWLEAAQRLSGSGP